MIQVQNVSRYYDNFLAVDDVSFQIENGQIVGLLGHNGAGKTTIMKMLTGFLQVTQGKIMIDGHDISVCREKVQSLIGYLPELPPTYPDLTVMEYLEYTAELKNIPKKQFMNSIAAVVKKAELTDKALQPIRTLSRGYQQRVGVAQAILGDPKVLILDEPTNGLDPTQIDHMRALIRELSQHTTIILSTHIMQEVQALCDRVLILNQGKLALDSFLQDIQRGNNIVLSTDASLETTTSLRSSNPWIDEILPVTAGKRYNNFVVRILQGTSSEDDLDNYCATLTKTIVEKGQKVFAVHPEKRDLETIFKDIHLGKKGDVNAA